MKISIYELCKVNYPLLHSQSPLDRGSKVVKHPEFLVFSINAKQKN